MSTFKVLSLKHLLALFRKKMAFLQNKFALKYILKQIVLNVH